MKYIVRAAGLRGFKEVVSQLGGDHRALLRSCDLPADCLDDEDNLIDCSLGILLLEQAARELNCPDLGLQISARQDATILGPVALALRHSATVGEALECTSRYLYVHSNSFTFSVHFSDAPEGKVAELRFNLLLPNIPAARQFWDISLGTTVRVFKFLTNLTFPIKAVYVPHSPVAAPAVYRQTFGDRIFFEQPFAAVVIAAKALQMPLRECDQKLQEIAVHYLNTNYANTSLLSDKVRLAVMNTLDTRQNHIGQISDLLNLHTRTLQRRLESEGTSFELLRDVARRDAAKRYLTSTRLPLAQIAQLLGLSEHSALTRSCKRWFGETPLAIRKVAK